MPGDRSKYTATTHQQTGRGRARDAVIQDAIAAPSFVASREASSPPSPDGTHGRPAAIADYLTYPPAYPDITRYSAIGAGLPGERGERTVIAKAVSYLSRSKYAIGILDKVVVRKVRLQIHFGPGVPAFVFQATSSRLTLPPFSPPRRLVQLRKPGPK